ncbi:MAG: hypothetical protein ACYCUF_10270, partial [Acidimicrobiales bacterium]
MKKVLRAIAGSASLFRQVQGEPPSAGRRGTGAQWGEPARDGQGEEMLMGAGKIVTAAIAVSSVLVASGMASGMASGTP